MPVGVGTITVRAISLPRSSQELSVPFLKTAAGRRSVYSESRIWTIASRLSLSIKSFLMSSPETATSPRVHSVAVKGFDAEPDAYERCRPTFPGDAVRHLETHLCLIPGKSHVLDLGAGSGKFTRLLVPRSYHITAVEPSPSMRATFAEVLPGVLILDGTAFSIPVESGSQDAVIAAQAFHWFANIHTLREIHRVLKPEGRLGLIWNLEDRSARKWVASLRDLYEKYEMGSPQYRLGLWREVWQTREAEELFSKLEEAHFEHEMLCTDEIVWGRVCSKSYVACQSDEVKCLLKEQVLATLQTAHDLDRDANGFIRYPYKTDVAWCAKV